MTGRQLLRVIWVRRWLTLALFLAVAVIGTGYALWKPKAYSAEALLVLDVRPDPILGTLGAAAGMSTQIELMKTEKVAARAVQILDLANHPEHIKHWRDATDGKLPIERYYTNALALGLKAEPVRGSNIIELSFSADTPEFAIAAVNALAQAVTDVAVDMRVEPARESADWYGVQAKSLRTNLEGAQTKLSRYQQEHGIVVTSEKVSEEVARLNALEAQLLTAQAARLDASSRQRDAGSAMSAEVQLSATVQNLKAQLAAAEIKLAEVSGVLGTSHPQRLQLETQVAGLRQQLSAEIGRVAGGASVTTRVSAQKVDELRTMVNLQKKQVLGLQSQRDEIAVLQRDIETAQRAYEAASQRAGQLNLESQVNQTGVRMLSPAKDAADTSQKKMVVGIIGSLIAGAMLAIGAAFGLEMIDRRVRGIEDLDVGFPVLGVLEPPWHERKLVHRLLSTDSAGRRRLLPMAPGQP